MKLDLSGATVEELCDELARRGYWNLRPDATRERHVPDHPVDMATKVMDPADWQDRLVRTVCGVVDLATSNAGVTMGRGAGQTTVRRWVAIAVLQDDPGGEHLPRPVEPPGNDLTEVYGGTPLGGGEDRG